MKRAASKSETEEGSKGPAPKKAKTDEDDKLIGLTSKNKAYTTTCLLLAVADEDFGNI